LQTRSRRGHRASAISIKVYYSARKNVWKRSRLNDTSLFFILPILYSGLYNPNNNYDKNVARHIISDGCTPYNDRVEPCHCEARLLPTASGGVPSNSRG
jgi:hypothetical protein